MSNDLNAIDKAKQPPRMPVTIPGLRQPPLGHEEPPVVEPHVPGPDGRTDFQALVEIVGQFPKKEESED